MTKTDQKRGRGRPRKQIDPDMVERLSRIHCTTEEIASIMGCDPRTLERNFAALMKKGREEGRASIRRQQYKLATEGNPTMCIWLGKQLLGQRDRWEQGHTGENGGPLKIVIEHVRRNMNGNGNG